MSMLAGYLLLAFAVSLALTPVFRAIALRTGFLAKPKSDRWHTRPTALFGGVAIVTTIVALLPTFRLNAEVWQLFACSVAIAGFGFVDDLLSVKASTKLIAQITVAAVLLFFGYRVHWTESLVGDTMITMFWIVGITNGFNLLDNMDGLCGGITIVAGGFLLFGLGSHGVTPPAIYLALLLGATVGFLIYNVHPASIFLGDTGSLFLGLNLAALTLMVQPGSPGKSGVVPSIVAPVLLLLIPILDTALVTAMRLLAGRKPSQGGRDHSSHRLVALGLPEPTAVAVLWTLALLGGGIALSVQRRDLSWVGIPAFAFFLAMMIFTVFLARIHVYEDATMDAVPAKSITPLVADFMYKRRVAEVLLDLCLIPLAYYTAYRLRFEGADLTINYPVFLQSVPIVIACQLVALFIVGGYRGTWRFFGMMDAVVFAKGVILGTVSSMMTIVFLYHFGGYSRAVFVIYGALLMLLLAGSRASFRLVGEFTLRRTSSGQRCVIYGTSGASVATIREAFDEQPLKILGFADDDPMQANARVAGYSVIGDFAHLVLMVESGDIDCVVINTRVADVDRLQRLEAVCREREVDLVKIQLNLKPFHIAS